MFRSRNHTSRPSILENDLRNTNALSERLAQKRVWYTYFSKLYQNHWLQWCNMYIVYSVLPWTSLYFLYVRFITSGKLWHYRISGLWAIYLWHKFNNKIFLSAPNKSLIKCYNCFNFLLFLSIAVVKSMYIDSAFLAYVLGWRARG